MGLSIKKPTFRKVPVEVLNLRWHGPLSKGNVAAAFRCSACLKILGERRFAVAWIRDGESERSMRLCEDCGNDAETPTPTEARE